MQISNIVIEIIMLLLTYFNGKDRRELDEDIFIKEFSAKEFSTIFISTLPIDKVLIFLRESFVLGAK